jgi:predicted peptidase
MRTTLAVFLGFLALMPPPSQTLAQEQPGMQRPAQLDVQIPVRMGYLLYLPEAYEQQQSWPLVLFLHGAGERGDDLEKVEIHGPPKLIAAGKHFPFVCVSPQCPEDSWWDATQLLALLDEVVRTHKIDEDRIYVTGLSMGGFGTWELAARAPRRFAAIAPICGGGEAIPLRVRRFAHLPVWAFHGAEDNVVPLERSQQMVEILEKEGGAPKLTIYPDAAHDSWTETYNNPELYEWLLAQRRKTE